jgi:hypothetical protein
MRRSSSMTKSTSPMSGAKLAATSGKVQAGRGPDPAEHRPRACHAGVVGISADRGQNGGVVLMPVTTLQAAVGTPGAVDQ